MTRKRKLPPPADPVPGPAEYTRMIVSPEFAAMRVVWAATPSDVLDQMDVGGLIRLLREQGKVVNRGDLAQAEAMLTHQAVALQSLFARLVERGMSTDVVAHYEAHMRLALRAQAQCARTLEVLATVKNPPVVIARQANIAQQQQVNNGPAVPGPVRARNPASAPTQLLETLPDERLEFGTAGAASGADSPLATVGTVNRT